MVIYQLPNGKIIRLTLEEYLDLTDEDINQLVGMDCGESATSPWLGSIISLNLRSMDISQITDQDDEEPDFTDFKNGLLDDDPDLTDLPE